MRIAVCDDVRAAKIAALGVFFARIALFMCVLYDYFSGVQKKQLKIQTDLAAQAVANEGIEYFDGLNTAEYRITWIGPDGTVIRLSVSQNTVFTLLLGMSQPLIFIFGIAVVLSLVLAYRLSKQIAKPLNELNLDNPLENTEYDELDPLPRRNYSIQIFSA